MAVKPHPGIWGLVLLCLLTEGSCRQTDSEPPSSFFTASRIYCFPVLGSPQWNLSTRLVQIVSQASWVINYTRASTTSTFISCLCSQEKALLSRWQVHYMSLRCIFLSTGMLALQWIWGDLEDVHVWGNVCTLCTSVKNALRYTPTLFLT